MGAPANPSRSPAKSTPQRSVAHRFAGACGKRLADVMVLGVRCDDDELKDLQPRAQPYWGETLVLRLRPGRLEPASALAGAARCIACCGRDVVVVDDRSALRGLDGALLLEGVLDLFDDRANARVLALRDDGAVTDVVTGAQLLRVPGGRAIRGGVIVTPDAIVGLDGATLHEGCVDVACAGAPGRLAWSRGRNLVVDGRAFMLAQPAHALCFGFGKLFVGSQVNGLSVVDDDGLRSLRPSLRAHGLSMLDDGLLVVCDLMVATSDDGVDFVSRDLAAYVRLAAHHSDKHAQHA